MTAFILSALCLVAAAFNGLIVWGQYKNNNQIDIVPLALCIACIGSAIAVPFMFGNLF